MPANPEASPAPRREEVEKVFEDLIGNRCSREQASDWAARWANADDPNIEDEAVWEALGSL